MRHPIHQAAKPADDTDHHLEAFAAHDDTGRVPERIHTLLARRKA